MANPAPAQAPVPPVTQVPAAMAKLSQGRLLLAQQRPGEALGLLAEAAEAEPNNPEVQLAYARALWGTGSREDAVSRFETAMRLGGSRFRTEYTSALLESGRTAEARRVLEETLAANPQDAQALETLGQLHNREGRTAEAAVLLTRLAALRPNDVQLVAHLGYALERNGDLEQAAEVMSRVVAAVPASTIARELLAEAQFKQGRRDEAVAVVRQGLEQKPDSPELHRRLGSLLERAGRAGEAAAAYREYLRLAPQAGDAKALAERAGYLERTSNSSSAS
jgi:Flp pilus assembly protein TadD